MNIMTYNNYMEKKPKITEQITSKGVIESLRTPEQISTKEYIFRNIVENKILDSFLSDMESAGFSPEQVEQFESMLTEDINIMPKIIAFPRELKKRSFSYFSKEILNGRADMRFMYDNLKKRAKLTNPKIAYHCGNNDIRPKTLKDINREDFESWSISGTEKDHRDDDKPMAYYSFDYMNLYRKKNPKYLYLIESNPKHRTDGVEWGRAPTLDVIEKLDLREVDAEVDRQYSEYLKNEEKKEARPEAA